MPRSKLLSPGPAVCCALGAALVLLPACGPGEGAAPEHLAGQVTDSAGITIVEHGAFPDDLPEWRLAAQPELRIGVVDGAGPEAFTRVPAMVRRSDGSLVVYDVATRELRAFGPDGSHLWTAGGPGEGPGEFGASGVGALGLLPGDSLVAGYPARRQAFVYTPEGRFARTIPAAPEGTELEAATLRGTTAGGSLVFSARIVGSSTVLANEAERSRLTIGWLDPLGVLVARAGADVGSQPVIRGEVQMTGPDGQEITGLTVMAPRYAPSPVFAVGPGRSVLADQERFDLRIYREEGTPEMILRMAGDPIPVDERRELESALERAETSQDRARARRTLETRPQWETLPAFGRIMVDDEDRLWVEGARTPWEEDEGPVPWWVFSRDGAFLATLRFPERFTPHVIAEGEVIGVRLDDLDVPWVERYRIEADGEG